MKFDKGISDPKIQKMADEVEEIAKEQKKSKSDLYFDKEDLQKDGVIDLSKPQENKVEGEVKDEVDKKVDDIIQQATNDQVGIKTNLRKEKIKEYEEIEATKEFLFSRKEKEIPIKIPINEEEALTFFARRLSEREMQVYFDRKLMMKNQNELTDDEVEKLRDKNLKLLSKVIVKPSMEPEEWDNIDAPLSNELGIKVAKLLSNINEGEVLSDLKKK